MQPMIADGSTNISQKHACLNWQSGNGTTTHDIFFGSVNPPAFVTNQTATDYNLPALEANKTYYWRIDEKNSLGTTSGAVWSFTTSASPDSNLARVSTATASTVTGSATAAKAIDGVISSSSEWISLGEKNPWIKLSWAAPVTINTLEFHDRFNLVDKANGGILIFSDSSTISFNGIPNNGSAKILNFAPKTVTSVKFQIAGGEGSNVGLSEMQAFYPLNVGIEENGFPLEYALAQNYPNPFNPSTLIKYSLRASVPVSIIIYNQAGQQVKTLINTTQPAGNHSLVWNCTDLSSGIYFYEMKAGDFRMIKQAVVVK